MLKHRLPEVPEYSSDDPTDNGAPDLTRAIRMEAFDSLPRTVRAALCYAAARHDPVEVCQRRQQHNLSEQETVQLIVLSDAHMIAKG